MKTTSLLFEHIMMNDERWLYRPGHYNFDEDDASAKSLKKEYGWCGQKTSFPKGNPYTNGRLKRVPAACLFIAKNPGCSRKEIQAAVEEQGWTSKNTNMFAHLRQQNLVRTHQEGRTPYYYPTFRCIDYLKMLGLIDKNDEVPYTVNGIFDESPENSKRRATITSINRKETNTDNVDFDDD